jgi:hypothetical protein
MGKGVFLVSPLFLWSPWAHSLWWRVFRKGRFSGLASVPFFDVGSVTVVADR